ncbi:ferritin heavy chain B-like [Chiloscyllium punctatum]|uniref:Ferritin n=1 Tax=Chiloscyllium punctatum TaxID=137246 RepID=A0A401RNQ3_CHIPU|nr:hypothetical protein [Chiloscyllium punctatum]
MASQLRQNYHQDCEAVINRQINMELYASYVYMSMYAFFDPDDVTLKHVAKFFQHQSHEEREHAEKLMKFQHQRGGRAILQDVAKLDRLEWRNTLEAMRYTLHLEKTANQSLLELHKPASDKVNPHMCDFLKPLYLDEQVQAIKKLGDFITNLTCIGAPQNGMAEYLCDKHTLGESSS